jgi:hypothetical protein
MESSQVVAVDEAGSGDQARPANPVAAWLDRAIIGCLFALAFCAPHSIAATQGFWVLGLALWTARLFARPRPRLRFHRTKIAHLLLAFLGLTVISSLFSYDVPVSVDRLRGVMLMTIVFLVAENIPNRRVLRQLALVLVASCMINVVFTIGERVIGRGVKVRALVAASPLRAAGIEEGDTLLALDGHKLHNPDEIDRALAQGGPGSEPARVTIYRFERIFDVDVPRGQLLSGTTAAARLGVAGWSRGRDWRAAGFYGHYATYAEVLQLIASLAVGLLVALPDKRTLPGLLLAAAIAGMSVALFLTITRASWLSFLISTFVIVLIGAGRRAVLVMLLAAAVVIPIGLFMLQQKRNVGFYDTKDGSITWRQTVYREGLQLLISRPRHLIVGIGMDSIKSHWREWGMFDHGRLPRGHMHSTPLQLALERGLPALFVWLALLAVYARMLWLLARSGRVADWVERGIVFGALGGLAGFFASGMVHYNMGDSEVIMIFYFLMGLALKIDAECRARDDKNAWRG